MTSTGAGARFERRRGQRLVLALVIVTVVALVVGGLLSFGDTSVRATVAFAPRRRRGYRRRRRAGRDQRAAPEHVQQRHRQRHLPKCFGDVG